MLLCSRCLFYFVLVGVKSFKKRVFLQPFQIYYRYSVGSSFHHNMRSTSAQQSLCFDYRFYTGSFIMKNTECSSSLNSHFTFLSGILSAGTVYWTCCSSCPAHTHWSSDSCLDRKIRAYIQTKKLWHLGKVFTLCNQTSFSTVNSVSGSHVSIWQGTIRFNVKPFLCSLFPQALSSKWMQLEAHG